MFLRIPLCAVAIASLFTIAGCSETDPVAAKKAALDREYKTNTAQILELGKQASQFTQLFRDPEASDTENPIVPEAKLEDIQTIAKKQLGFYKREVELAKQYREIGMLPPTMEEMGLDDSFVAEMMERTLDRLETLAQREKK
jgi:hypothetical protein